MTGFTIAGYWGRRPDEPETCASSLMAVIASARDLDPAYGRLFRSRDRPRDPLIPMPTDPHTLATVIRAGRLRNDTDRRPMDGGGYIEMWDDNTRRFDQARVAIFCGATATPPPNGIVISVPPEVTAASTTPAAVSHVFRTIIDSFDPVWAVVEYPESLRHRGAKDQHLPGVSWMLYLRGTEHRPFEVRGVIIEQMPHGQAFTTTNGWFDPSDPRDVAVALELERALFKSGRLREAWKRVGHPG